MAVQTEGGTSGPIIAVLGLAGSGKSVAVEHVREILAVSPVYFGGVVVEEVKARGWQVTPENERLIREELRRTEGMNVMAKRSLPAVEVSLATHGAALVDGLYSGAELDLLSSTYGSALSTIAVHADRQVRESRLSLRPTRPLSPAEMTDRDKAELLALDKAVPITMAKFHVTNNTSHAEFTSALDRVLRLIGVGLL